MNIARIINQQSKPIVKRQPCVVGSQVENNGISFKVDRCTRDKNNYPCAKITVSSPVPGYMSSCPNDRCLQLSRSSFEKIKTVNRARQFTVELEANHSAGRPYGCTFFLRDKEIESMQLLSSERQVLARVSVEPSGCLLIFGRDKLNVEFFNG